MFTRGLSPARPGVRRGPRVIDLDMVAVGQWGDPNWGLGEPILERFHGGKRGNFWRFLAKTCWELWNSWCFLLVMIWEKREIWDDLRTARIYTELQEWIICGKKLEPHLLTGQMSPARIGEGTCSHGTNHSYKRIITKDRQVWRFEKLDS